MSVANYFDKSGLPNIAADDVVDWHNDLTLGFSNQTQRGMYKPDYDPPEEGETTGPVERAEGIAKYVAARNLLVNWDMEMPVNQQDLSTYDGGLTIDCWKIHDAGNASKVEVVDSAVVFTSGGPDASLRQYVEYPNRYRGMTLTASALMMATGGAATISILYTPTGGTETEISATAADPATYKVLSKTFVVPDVPLDSLGIAIGKDAALQTKTTIKRVGLETGIVSTLAYASPSDYITELARCQRYGFVHQGSAPRFRAQFYYGEAIDFIISCPMPLRASPVLPDTLQVINYSPGREVQTGFTFSVNNRASGWLNIRATKAAHGLTDAFLTLTAQGFFDANV